MRVMVWKKCMHPTNFIGGAILLFICYNYVDVEDNHKKSSKDRLKIVRKQFRHEPVPASGDRSNLLESAKVKNSEQKFHTSVLNFTRNASHWEPDWYRSQDDMATMLEKRRQGIEER